MKPFINTAVESFCLTPACTNIQWRVSNMSTKIKKILIAVISLLGIVFVFLSVIARRAKRKNTYADVPKEKNLMEGKKVTFVEDESDEVNADGVKGHLEVIGDIEYHPSLYVKYVKRILDIILSFLGLIILSPVFAIIAIAIKIEDPGPVFFTQKRVGQNKQYFKLHKFRSMKVSTPHDVPTHMLKNPDQYITKVGAFIRRHSLDELPQIWDIFVGTLSCVGPRPGLWNQDLLISERDKYGANDVKPGLTGWAQINGRDECEIADKAKLDGEYCKKIGLLIDIKCFLGTVIKIFNDDSVVEGERKSEEANAGDNHSDLGKIDLNKTSDVINVSNSFEPLRTDDSKQKRVLITGAHSYIGESFKRYMDKFYAGTFIIDTISVRDDLWKKINFSPYDCILHVAGIAHVKETKQNCYQYYKVNRDLTIELATKAKKEGVHQFIVLSSMSVYGMTNGHIMKYTMPAPVTAYGDSKLQADMFLQKIEDNTFKVAILRPPMVYGKECKGNYQSLRSFALKSYVFPSVFNQRSMIYIGNLCEFIYKIIIEESRGVFFPQNKEYISTSNMVKIIAKLNGKKVILIPILNPLIRMIPVQLIKKVFGNLTYERVDTIDTFDFIESLRLSEEKGENDVIK